VYRFRHWFAELLLVFVGAYAAFWLNGYQEHREEARRHDQILAALENEVTEAIESGKSNSAHQAKVVADFQRAYEAGQMPPLHPFNFTTDYSATDTATLLESGGYQLLQVKTLIALRNVESTLRAGLSTIAHFQKLSDEMIVPNLDEEITFFYDPATRKLRKRFAAYPEALAGVKTFLDDYVEAETNLLKQIQAERRHR
jgi:hypothetical protein